MSQSDQVNACFGRDLVQTERFMASGLLMNCINMPETGRMHGCTDWSKLHKENSCQNAAVHTWPLAWPLASEPVHHRFRPQMRVELAAGIFPTCLSAFLGRAIVAI